MIRQPVSRISFDRGRGFLGVHLQEGALFVDAAWNEAADIAWSQLRDAILAGGLAGTAGRELRIDPVVDSGRLRNLCVRGTSADPAVPPRPFYCNGLPVLWPADLEIDKQGSGDGFRPDPITRDDGTAPFVPDPHVPPSGTWIDRLKREVVYEIYLRACVATLDRLDDPFLDDPGLDAARGTFRKRVVAEIRIREADASRMRVRTNVKLSVDGSYLSGLNVLYRVELDAFTGSRATPAASVLWDPDAAATVARVVDTALAGARQVMVDTTEGFDAGFVRFEGKGVGPELYRVAKAPGLEGAALQVTRHRCDRAERSLATWQTSGALPNPTSPPFAATFVVPPAMQTGDEPAIQEGDLVTALPVSSDSGPWTVLKVEPKITSETKLVTLTFGPAGLAGPLLTLDTGRSAALCATARQFDTTLVVAARHDWKVGERISILAKADQGAVTPAAIAAREDRVIVRIEQLPRGLAAGERRRASGSPAAAATMLVRLDQPLSFDHAPTDVDVIPERLIRVRRFAGHECRLPIDVVDPAGDGAASLDNFTSGLALPQGQPHPRGLALHLTIEKSDGEPRIGRGDGWHFAARSDGFVETRLFAPVEDEPASEVPLAQLKLCADRHELVDLRPLPAALAVDDELERIGAAAATLAGLLDDDPAADLVKDVASLASFARVQPGLVERLYELAVASHSKLHASPAARPWLERLEAAVAEVETDTEPTRRQLARIGFAISGLAFAFSTSAPAPYPTSRPGSSTKPPPSTLTPPLVRPPGTGTSPPAPYQPPTPAPTSSAPPAPVPPTSTPPAPVPPAPSTSSHPAPSPKPTTSPAPTTPTTPTTTTTPPSTKPTTPTTKPAAGEPSKPPPGPAAKLEHKHGFLDKAEAVLGEIKDDLAAAATLTVAGLEAAAELARATRPDATKPDATKPDATKPDATKPDATRPATQPAKKP